MSDLFNVVDSNNGDLIACSGAIQEADTLRASILTADDYLGKRRIKYYVSPNGDDDNDGKSPEKPIRTLGKVRMLPLRSGDAVLFERGSVFRTDDTVYLRGGVAYGAYGTGAKPAIYGSILNYADAKLWTKNDRLNVWCLSLPYGEAGVITFDCDSSVGFAKRSIDEVKSDGDYYHDVKNGVLYLCCRSGNPGEAFTDIEIGTTADLLFAQNVNDVVIDNLCLKYGSIFAMNFGNNKEIAISNCEIAWCGGADYNGKIRYGNGIQFWYRCEQAVVRNCWIHQIFDAALTFQGSGCDAAIFKDITFENNLIEYSSMNFEFWAGGEGHPEPVIHNILVRENIIRLSGYGWGGIQRPDKGDQAAILGWNRSYQDMQNFVIENNILDCADCNLIFTHSPEQQSGLIVRENTYFQKKTSGINSFVEIVRGSGLYANNQEELEQAILTFETSPKQIRWL